MLIFNTIKSSLSDAILNKLKRFYYRAKLQYRNKAFRTAVMPYPSQLNLAFTLKCMAACPHCIFLQENIDTFAHNEMLTKESLSALLNKECMQEIRSVACGGGEALLNPEVFDHVKVLKAHSNVERVQVFTNGVSLQKDEIVEGLIADRSITNFLVSLDAITEDDYIRIKGLKKTKWDKMLKNIKRVNEERNAREGAVSGIGYVIGEHNIEQVKAMVDFSAELKASFCYFTTLHITDEKNIGKLNTHTLMGMPSQYNALMAKDDHPINIYIQPPIMESQLRFYCDSLATHLSLSPNGLIAPCCRIAWNEEYGMLSTTEKNPINHPKIMVLREAFMKAAAEKNEKLLPKECVSCPNRLKGCYFYNHKFKTWDLVAN